MSTEDGPRAPDAGPAEPAPPPPPSAALLASVEAMAPVHTRSPARGLLLIATAACVYPICAIALHPLRRDLAALPVAWLAAVSLAWLSGFVLPLAVAVLPSRGQVMPRAAWAGRAAIVAGSTLVLMGLLFTVDAPGRTIVPGTTWANVLPWSRGCLLFGLKVSVPAIVVGAIVLRRIAAADLSRLGAAVGAAAGALAGLTLTWLCPVGGAPHVALAHGGGVVLGAALGWLSLPRLARIMTMGTKL